MTQKRRVHHIDTVGPTAPPTYAVHKKVLATKSRSRLEGRPRVPKILDGSAAAGLNARSMSGHVSPSACAFADIYIGAGAPKLFLQLGWLVWVGIILIRADPPAPAGLSS